MSFFWAHIIFMGAAMLFLASAFCIVRFFRRRPGWLKLHRLAGISGATCLIAGLAAAVIMVSQSGDGHLRVPHTWLGAAAVIAGTLTPVVGLLQFKLTAKSRQLRLLHRILGYITLALLPLSIISGAMTAGFF